MIQIIRARDVALFLCACTAWSGKSYGQSDESAQKGEPSATVGAEAAETSGSVAPDSAKGGAAPQAKQDVKDRQQQLEEDVAALKAQVKAQASEISGIKKDYNEKIESAKQEYDEKLDEAALADMNAGTLDNMQQKLNFYGFYDFTISKRFLEEGAFVEESIANTKLQFLIQNLNLYFSSQPAESLSFLAELHFTFLPNGGSVGLDPTLSSVSDTTVTDPYTQNQITLGGVDIEQVWLKWNPFEFLGVKVGYFPTPYGIWQVDHGSPVRLSILPPFENNTVTPTFIRGKFPVPNKQLGFVLFGQVFPYKDIAFDYELTVSNGRGPADTVIDYDTNKAVGLKLKLSYKKPNLEISAGCYGYFGEYTDQQVSLQNGIAATTTENYKEYVITTDLLILFYGVRLQAEHITGLTRYIEEARPAEMSFMSSGTTFTPDYVANYVYGLLGYRLPLDKWLKNMTLTPYFGAEFDVPRDYMPWFKNFVFWWGLNFSPSPVISIKIEGARNHMEYRMGDSGMPSAGGQKAESNIWTVAGQLAVSF